MTFLAPGARSPATGRWQPLNLPAWWPTYLLCKWKSERSGQSASQSLATCLRMTLTWCPGMSPGRPRSFPILEKCSAKCNSFSQMVTPQSPFAPYIPPVCVLTWQQFNSLCTIFFHVCYQISSYTKFLFFQGLIRLKVQILQDNRRTGQIWKALMQISVEPMNSSRVNAELGLRGIWIQIIFVPRLACFIKHTANNSTDSVKLLAINNNLPLKRNVKCQSCAPRFTYHPQKELPSELDTGWKVNFPKWETMGRTEQIRCLIPSHMVPLSLRNLVLIPPASTAPGWVTRQPHTQTQPPA